MNFIDFLSIKSHNQDEIAIIDSEGLYTYRDLASLVFSLSTWINATIGVRQTVALISENSIFFIASYLGIIHSGNVCIPINPSITEKNLAHILAQSHAKTGFLHPKVESKFSGHFPNIANQDLVFSLPPANSDQDVNHEFNPSEIAEIIFTSGSTARPKGVMLSHNNLMANTQSIISYLRLTKDDRIAAVLPFYYCYGLSLLHTHLKVGGSIVLNNTFMMLNSLINDINNHKCTGFAGVPSHFQIMLRKSRKFRESQYPTLRYVTQAGGRLPNSFITQFTDLFPHIKFYVMYGQTEATSRLSYLPPEMLMDKLGSIGKGIPSVRLEVIDNDGHPVSPGSVGEIVGSGENIMVGYLNDPELTSETIKDGKLLTGDIGTVDEEGYIYVVAREKEFIKVGGERVSPKEIEEVISSLESVIDCSIVGIEDDLTGEAIVAYVVLNEMNILSEKDIIAYCTEQLSSEKVPKYIEFVDKIDLSDTGKKVLMNNERLMSLRRGKKNAK